ncbi:MAG: carbon-nitrogen hydrolase family protein [Bulleidia sp.]
MRCALAAIGFVNGNTGQNQKTIIETMHQMSGKADVVIFGETFLQGFYAPVFDEEQDRKTAVDRDSTVIREIRTAAGDYRIAVSFGFFEMDHGKFYSSQITIDLRGKIIDLFRRVSPGWKEKHAGKAYCEGTGFHLFEYLGKKIVIGLCGDLWYDQNIEAVVRLKPDIVWWPVYTDFPAGEWNRNIIFEYAQQSKRMRASVLYVNSVCLDRFEDNEIAKGGAAVFVEGSVVRKIPAGKEGILLTESVE